MSTRPVHSLLGNGNAVAPSACCLRGAFAHRIGLKIAKLLPSHALQQRR